MLRKLKSAEIEEILQYAIVSPVNIDSENTRSLIHNAKCDFRKQLSEISVYPQIIIELKEEIKDEYRRSMIEAGKSVGIHGAMSIGEPTTQMVLNTFHSSGISAKTIQRLPPPLEVSGIA